MIYCNAVDSPSLNTTLNASGASWVADTKFKSERPKPKNLLDNFGQACKSPLRSSLAHS